MIQYAVILDKITKIRSQNYTINIKCNFITDAFVIEITFGVKSVFSKEIQK